LDSPPGKVIEDRADGTVVVKINGVETARGKWLVSNGNFIGEPAEGSIETNKVLSISQDKAVLLSIDGETQLTFHRR